MGQPEHRHKAGKGGSGTADVASIRPPATAADAARFQGPARGRGARGEVALLVTFSVVSIAMSLYLSTFMPRPGQDGASSRGESGRETGVVIVARGANGPKLAVPARVEMTVSELRREVSRRIEEVGGVDGWNTYRDVGRFTLQGSGAVLSASDVLRHLGLTAGGQLQVVAEPTLHPVHQTDVRGASSPSVGDDPVSDRATEVDAGGDHDNHGRSLGLASDGGGGGGAVPPHSPTRSHELASVRPGPVLGQLKDLIRGSKWEPAEDKTERSAIRLPDGIFPEPLKYIRVWKSGLTRKQCRKVIKDAERRNDWQGYSKFGDDVKTQDVGVDKLSQETMDTVSEMLERLQTFVHNKFIVSLPDLDGGRLMRGGKKVSPEEADLGFQHPVNLKGVPFVIKYNATDESSNLYTHKDNSDISFILLLSDPKKDFEGGGTYFYDLNEALHLRQGDALVFSGQLVHEAARITKGLRYVIAGFTLFDPNWMKMKRLGTLATMSTLQR